MATTTVFYENLKLDLEYIVTGDEIMITNIDLGGWKIPIKFVDDEALSGFFDDIIDTIEGRRFAQAVQ